MILLIKSRDLDLENFVQLDVCTEYLPYLLLHKHKLKLGYCKLPRYLRTLHFLIRVPYAKAKSRIIVLAKSNHDSDSPSVNTP